MTPSGDALPADTIRVRARIVFLAASEGGRTAPIFGDLRPNHNFLGPENRQMTIGRIELRAVAPLNPGEGTEVVVEFSAWPGLDWLLRPGREWRIQEGLRPIGFGTVLEVLPDLRPVEGLPPTPRRG